MNISNDDIKKELLRRVASQKRKQYSIIHLLKLLDIYDAVRRGQCKIQLMPDGEKTTSFHTIAKLNVTELFNYAVGIKTGNPNLPDVPEPCRDPDLDVSRLRQWAINAQNILTGKKADLAKKPSETEQKDTAAKWRRIWIWLKKHPHSYGLTAGSIFLILFFILGLFKVQWRNWCWGVAGLAFLVLILSLLGGRSSR